MKPKWTPRPDIKPGDIIGKPAGWTPESDLDHRGFCGDGIDHRLEGAKPPGQIRPVAAVDGGLAVFAAATALAVRGVPGLVLRRDRNR